MKSRKYRKFYASKYEFPTRVVRVGSKGDLQIGHVRAQRAIEDRIKRTLKPVKIETRGGNWVFCELREARK